jgi:RND family efflux transporter MFP subunit
MFSASSAVVRRIGCPIVFGALLAACGEQNAYVPPPPPKVDVAVPAKQTVTPYLYATGNTAAVNTTTLIARVSGFIQEIDYKDGDTVKEGTKLFVIEPEPYQLALEQAQAGEASAAAAAQQSAANYDRTDALLKKGVETQQNLDAAAAQKAADAAKQQQSGVDVKQAQLNLDYTEVKAPFDGIATERQVSMGQLVNPGTSELATVVQLDPIHVNFNVSEQDVQKIRANMMARGVVNLADLKEIRSRPSDR